MSIDNIAKKEFIMDPFSIPESTTEEKNENIKIHVQYQQRNGRKGWTNIHGLNTDDNNIKVLIKTIKKKFACSTTIKRDEDNNNIIQLQGDHRDGIKELLVTTLNISAKNIVLRGA